MAGTVWLSNCNNYYRHANGKVVTQFPYSGRTFADRLKAARLDDLHLAPRLETASKQHDSRY